MVITRAKNNNSATSLGLEDRLWLSVDKLRNKMGAAEYKRAVLGFLSLSYILGAFLESRAQILGDEDDTDAATYMDCIWHRCSPESLRNIANEVSAHA
jgi:type I restriction-modification system DNA methylase subunit